MFLHGRPSPPTPLPKRERGVNRGKPPSGFVFLPTMSLNLDQHEAGRSQADREGAVFQGNRAAVQNVHRRTAWQPHRAEVHADRAPDDLVPKVADHQQRTLLPLQVQARF